MKTKLENTWIIIAIKGDEILAYVESIGVENVNNLANVNWTLTADLKKALHFDNRISAVRYIEYFCINTNAQSRDFKYDIMTYKGAKALKEKKNGEK